MQTQFRSDDTTKWGQGFGNGSDGAYNPGSGTDNPINTTFAGSAGAYTGTIGSNSGFAIGNVVLIHQSRNGGDGAGNWMFNYITNIVGTAFTFLYPLSNNFDTTAQIQKLPQYSSANIAGGVTITGSAWNGATGGIFGFFCNGPVTIAGAINVNGNPGAVNASNQHNTPGGSGVGYQGGAGVDNQNPAYYAEGIAASSGVSSNSNPNGNGGGGGKGNGGSNNGGGGGGGGNAGSGGNGHTAGAGGAYAGNGGNSAGSTDLTNMVFGGGGGGSGDGPNASSPDYGSGGAGGGLVAIVGRTINITGAITSNGGAGGSIYRSGGGGAGGSVLFKGQAITLGTNLITAAWGQGGGNSSGVAGGSSPGDGGGGNGANGRIHADYSTSLSGSTNPGIDSRLDPTIVPAANEGAFLNIL